MITENKLKDLLKAGKIKGYKGSSKSRHPSKPRTSKALTWLKWNLKWWADDNVLMMYTEYQFHPKRKWRFDWAIDPDDRKIAIEYEGGIFQPNTSHNSPRTLTKDTEKYHEAIVLGWKVIRVTALNYKSVLEKLNSLEDEKQISARNQAVHKKQNR